MFLFIVLFRYPVFLNTFFRFVSLLFVNFHLLLNLIHFIRFSILFQYLFHLPFYCLSGVSLFGCRATLCFYHFLNAERVPQMLRCWNAEMFPQTLRWFRNAQMIPKYWHCSQIMRCFLKCCNNYRKAEMDPQMLRWWWFWNAEKVPQILKCFLNCWEGSSNPEMDPRILR